MTELEPRVLYRDETIVVVDKPAGLLVHPNPHERGAPTCLWMLRDALGEDVACVHRIDRGASGLVLFAASRESAGLLAVQFRERSVGKRYLALVRGHLLEARSIDQPVPRDLGSRPVPSRSFVTPLARTVLPEPVSIYPEGWFTLAEVELLTGRMHQARKHLHHVNHPVIGDKKHGDPAQNRFFAERFDARELFLRAYRLRFTHPVTGLTVQACAGLSASWIRITRLIGITIPPGLAIEPSVSIG
jgi:tRNA pseudouridine65 synthase